MGKIPVLQTIAQTYAFAFRNYFYNLGVIWLPLLLFCAAGYYIFVPALEALPAFTRDLAQHAQQNPQVPYVPELLGLILRGIFLFEFVALLLVPVFAVGVTKEALGLRSGLRFVYLSIGKRELLVFGGILTILALYIGALILLVIIGGVVGGIIGVTMAGAHTGHVDAAAAVATTLMIVRVVSLLFYLVLFYFLVRLCFLMVPVTTAENRFGVWRSWVLTKGNFWRSVGTILGTFLPVTILTYAVWFAVAPGMLQAWWNAQIHPELAASNLASMVQAMTAHLLYAGVYFFVVSPISYGLMFGQSAFAYRALVGDKAAGPWER